METEKEFAVDMEIGKDCPNIEVAKALNCLFSDLFNRSCKIIVVKILPQENRIYIKPFTWLKEKAMDDLFIIDTHIFENELPNRPERCAFMFAETIVDFWNKFGADEFLMRFDYEDQTRVTIMINRGLTKSEINAYWFKDNQNGYLADGNFWNREWQKDEQKIPKTGGGKV